MVLKSINGVVILAFGARIGTLSSFSAAQGLEEGIKWEIPTTVKAVTGSPHLSASLRIALSQGSCLAQLPSPGSGYPLTS